MSDRLPYSPAGLLGRALSLDIVPRRAYWRPFTEDEERFDFSTMERAEGTVITGARVRLGVLLHVTIGGIILWTRSARYTRAAAGKFPIRNRAAIRDEWFRFLVRQQFAGQAFYRSGLPSRQAAAFRPSLAKAQANQLWSRAETLTDAFLASTLGPVRGILMSTWTGARRLKPQDYLESELRAVAHQLAPMQERGQFAELVKLASIYSSPDEAINREGAGFAVAKLYSQEGFDNPYYLATNPNAPRTHYPSMGSNVAAAWLQTEATRAFNGSVQMTALQDPNINTLTYSAVMDSRTCAVCRARDGIAREKDDDWWVFDLPPMHPRCRCRVIPSMAEATDWTPVDELNTIDPWAAGVGYGRPWKDLPDYRDKIPPPAPPEPPPAPPEPPPRTAPKKRQARSKEAPGALRLQRPGLRPSRNDVPTGRDVMAEAGLDADLISWERGKIDLAKHLGAISDEIRDLIRRGRMTTREDTPWPDRLSNPDMMAWLRRAQLSPETRVRVDELISRHNGLVEQTKIMEARHREVVARAREIIQDWLPEVTHEVAFPDLPDTATYAKDATILDAARFMINIAPNGFRPNIQWLVEGNPHYYGSWASPSAKLDSPDTQLQRATVVPRGELRLVSAARASESRARSQTMAHEIAHSFQHALQDDALRKKLCAWRARRVQEAIDAGEEPVSSCGRQPCYRDRFWRSDGYTSRRYPHQRADGPPHGGRRVGSGGLGEIVSTGLELLYQDPVRFAIEDPEHFDLMLEFLWSVRRAAPLDYPQPLE